MPQPQNHSGMVTAAVLVIGDEILSGRTKDTNTNYIANYLQQLGIELREARTVPDVETEIVDALNALRSRYTYVFTTGGIGPTHDDITADSVGKALGLEVQEDPRAIAMLLERLTPDQLNPARRRMARVPVGAELIENAISKAPGFMVGNVIVMAGVPLIMQSMLDAVAPRLRTGVRVMAETLDVGNLPEGRYAAKLEEIALRHHGSLSIGSYPSFSNNGVRNQIVIRGRDVDLVRQVAQEVREMVGQLTSDGVPG